MDTPNAPPATSLTNNTSLGAVIRFEFKISMWILAVVGLYFLLVIIAQILVAAGVIEQQPIERLWDVCRTVLLPIVTLILGHYFGARPQGSSK